MKIVFLDIDGVLNSQIYFERRHRAIKRAGNNHKIWGGYTYNDIDPKAVKILNDLAPHCKFVISSVWRGMKDPTVEKVLKAKGFKGEIVGKTGYGCKNCCRGTEVQGWLRDNEALLGVEYYRDFKDYVIIDDDSDFLLEQANHFFNTDYFVGITPKTVYQIKRFFGIEKKILM